MSTIHLERWTILVALVAALPSWGGEPAKVGVDLYGDPLPKGALARLGSVRCR
jgi:hypothetical protein